MLKENILIIDDEPVIREVLAEILTNADYSVSTASDGEEGYNKLVNESYDLVITDIKMPKLGGMPLIEKIRGEFSVVLPIIVITGHGTIDIAMESMRHGTQAFILKPFTPGEIRDAVEDVLDRSRIIKENIKLKATLPLFEVNKRLLRELNIDQLMDIIVEEAAQYTNSERTSLMLLENDGTLKMKAALGVDMNDDHTREYTLDIDKWVVKNRKSLLLDGGKDEIAPELESLMKNNEINSALCVPIIINNNLHGVLNLAKVSNNQPFTHSDEEVVSVLCGQAGIAIENARLYERVKSTHLDVIAALANAVEARDQYTANHAVRLSIYSCMIAEKMGISGADMETIKRGAILHDIGKIGIRDSILLKEAPLSNDEFHEMKEHPRIGSKILKRMNGLEGVVSIVMHHHEFYNGEGYPYGKKGDEIPLGARIVGVADAFEAMTSERPYRSAMSTEAAVEELERMAGIQFDPEVVKTFREIIEKDGLEIPELLEES
ncbi:MAG: response regulator [Deltaproteobacteria bacterium]|nr:response regulator [Deltaproteobacteria bacterium]